MPAELDTSASAQEGAPKICQAWTLTKSQAEEFFTLSKEIDSREFYHLYDTVPCKITGTLDAEGKSWKFSINGAAKAILTSDDEVNYFGCSTAMCEPLVMVMPNE